MSYIVPNVMMLGSRMQMMLGSGSHCQDVTFPPTIHNQDSYSRFQWSWAAKSLTRILNELKVEQDIT